MCLFLFRPKAQMYQRLLKSIFDLADTGYLQCHARSKTLFFLFFDKPLAHPAW